MRFKFKIIRFFASILLFAVSVDAKDALIPHDDQGNMYEGFCRSYTTGEPVLSMYYAPEESSYRLPKMTVAKFEKAMIYDPSPEEAELLAQDSFRYGGSGIQEKATPPPAKYEGRALISAERQTEPFSGHVGVSPSRDKACEEEVVISRGDELKIRIEFDRTTRHSGKDYVAGAILKKQGQFTSSTNQVDRPLVCNPTVLAEIQDSLIQNCLKTQDPNLVTKTVKRRKVDIQPKGSVN